jgi:hypothetical protein
MWLWVGGGVDVSEVRAVFFDPEDEQHVHPKH